MNLLRPSGLLLATCLLTGCTQWHYDLGRPLSRADIPDAEQNLSLHQVLTDLGPPQRMSATSNGYVLAWEHWQVKEQTLGLSLGALGAELFSLDWGDLQTKGEFLVVTFDKQHQLLSSTLSQWANDGGGGKAIQPFLSMVSVVDAGDLVGKMSQHRWGWAFMKPLPRALNKDSSSDTGQNGIEQRGTPTAIGQQSLEMN